MMLYTDAECCVGVGGNHGFAMSNNNSAEAVEDAYNKPNPYQGPSTVHPITGNELPDGCEAVVEPNRLAFKYGNGIEHSIYLPKGTYGKSLKLVEDKNWAELKKFPVWGTFSAFHRCLSNAYQSNSNVLTITSKSNILCC